MTNCILKNSLNSLIVSKQIFNKAHYYWKCLKRESHLLYLIHLCLFTVRVQLETCACVCCTFFRLKALLKEMICMCLVGMWSACLVARPVIRGSPVDHPGGQRASERLAWELDSVFTHTHLFVPVRSVVWRNVLFNRKPSVGLKHVHISRPAEINVL